MSEADRSTESVLVVGGGVAGLEAVLGLRHLCQDHVAIELLAPNETFVYKPLAVAEPFGLMPTYELNLAEFAREMDLTVRKGNLDRVDLAQRSVLSSTGESIQFDYLVIATGAAAGDQLPGAIRFAGPEGVDDFRALLGRLENGDVGRLVFAGAPAPSWLLPIYELALMTATFARNRGLKAELRIVTEESGPLAAFGADARAEAARLLDEAGIEVRTRTKAIRYEDGVLQIERGPELEADAVVSIPGLRGPAIPGLPEDEAGFVPIDDYGGIAGRSHDFAAGDVTNFPVKHGGIAAQQADAVAGKIAQVLGLPSDGRPFRAELDGTLLTGEGVHRLHTSLDTGGFSGGPHQQIPGEWTPLAKVSARYLGTYLTERESR